MPTVFPEIREFTISLPSKIFLAGSLQSQEQIVFQAFINSGYDKENRVFIAVFVQYGSC